MQQSQQAMSNNQLNKKKMVCGSEEWLVSVMHLLESLDGEVEGLSLSGN